MSTNGRMTRRRLLAGGAALAAAAAGFAGGSRPASAEEAAVPSPAGRGLGASYPSGLPWLSGLNPDGDAQSSTSNVQTWAAWRGRAVDLINVKGDRNDDWDEMVRRITGKGAVYAAYHQAGLHISQVVPLLPKQGGDTLVTVNQGAGDGYHAQIADWLAAQPRQSPFIIRLGHEMDDTDNIYSPANDPDQVHYSNYLGAFRRIADIYHTRLGRPPEFYIDQCHERTPQFDPDKIFPGPSYADIVGADVYYNKSAVPVTSDADFERYANLRTDEGWPSGPLAWMDFSRPKRVKFGIGEWGVTNLVGPGSMFDNPYYIRGMYDLFRRNSDILVYESYFNIGDHRLILADGTVNDLNARAAAQYQASWSPR